MSAFAAMYELAIFSVSFFTSSTQSLSFFLI